MEQNSSTSPGLPYLIAAFAGVEYIKRQVDVDEAASAMGGRLPSSSPVTRTPTMDFSCGRGDTRLGRCSWRSTSLADPRPLSPVCLPTAAQALRQTEHCAASKCCMRAAFQHSWFDHVFTPKRAASVMRTLSSSCCSN